MPVLKTPILFLVFNRPDTTKKVFESIREAKPAQLYIAADGPRKNLPQEVKKCKKVREIVTKVDWDCEVNTLFREENLGCKLAVSSAIDWFFENEEMGIILEDDCLPDQSFFHFCKELLEKYKSDNRVWHIGGYKYQSLGSDEFSYNFSRFTHVWGWATWRRAWKHYDVEIKKYQKHKEKLQKYDFFHRKKEYLDRKNILDKIIFGELDTWDYQWNFCVRINNGLAIRPRINLVKNIGFREDATHTQVNNEKSNVNSSIKFPLRHPDILMANREIDYAYIDNELNKGLISKYLKKIFR